MKKFYLFMLMAVGLLISGNVKAYTGTGTESDPYLVSTASDLSSLVRYNGGHIKLISDITYSSNYMQVGKPTTLDLDIYTITFEEMTSFGFYVYADFTINASFNDKTGHYGSIYNTALGVGASLSTIYVDDGSATVTINSGYIRSNGAPAIAVNNGSYGAGSLVLGAHASVESDNNPTDISASATSITFNGNFDGLHVSIGKNSTVINNMGLLTNVRWLDTKLNCVYNNTGTMTFAEESSIRQTTFDTYFTDANLAQGRYKEVNGKNYDIKRSIAKVGDVYYTDLKTALRNSSEDSPAILQVPISLSNSIEIFDFPNVPCLDLNGNTITSSTNYVFSIRTQGLIVEDNSAEHTGSINHTGSSCIFYAGNLVGPSILHIKGGTFNTTATGTSGGAIILSSINPTSSIIATIEGEYTTINCPNGGFGIGMFSNVEVNVKGGVINTTNNFCIANNGSDVVASYLNISGGTMTSTQDCAIYWPGSGIVNISGDNTVISGGKSGVEIRAGELNMTGGKVTCTGSTISCNPNGNGITTQGAGIAVAQHTTKQPVIVNISGGVVSGPFAIIQVNPQNNSEDDYLGMKVNVTGGKFVTTNNTEGTLFSGLEDYGTVTYDADAMLLSQNRRILVSGGYYKNYDPAPFVMPGYVSVLLSELNPKSAEDEQAIAEGYIYKVTKITEAGREDNSEINGDWHNDASSVWNSTKEPDKLTQVTIDGQEIIVSTPATAYGIEISGTQEGNTKLTITETGRLMVDLGGIDGTTPITFDIQNGGQMAIAPAATLETESQPEATVTFVADWARRKAAADDKEQGDLVAEDLYWQHIATPLSEGIAPTPSETGVSYVNTWNLVNGWTSATWANVVTPFVGYQISSIKPSDDKITLTYKGQLVGNHVDPMTFTRIGFSFFGNSYLAPIDIRELLTCLETKNVVDPTVLLYNSEAGYYSTINRASFYIPGMIAEIKPMQGFFVFAESAVNVDFDYTKAVWNSFCAKAQSGVVVPTAPKMQENPFSAIACIDVQAENGVKDRVMLFEGDELSAAEDKGYDAHKMITSGLNLYAKGSYADLAILATNNLLGSELILKTDANTNYTLSFANIKGEYALYDALTGRTINMVEGATYEFNAQANATITNRFFVVEAAKAPTAVENIDAQAGSCKFMKNGIMFIERNNKVYNAQGQIVK